MSCNCESNKGNTQSDSWPSHKGADQPNALLHAREDIVTLPDLICQAGDQGQ